MTSAGRPSRRAILTGGAVLGFAAALPKVAFADLADKRRFVAFILRGAMDGLHAVAPMGDPDYVSARAGLALERGGDKGAIDLDGTFALHPALAPLVPLWRKGEVMAVHAVASAYRQRSHFDGQDVLEGGGTRPQAFRDGWLNRALTVLHAGPRDALAVSQGIPLVLRGTAPAASWAPSPLPNLPPDLVERVAALYAGDPLLKGAFEEGAQAEAFADDVLADDAEMGKGRMGPDMPRQKRPNAFPVLTEAVGRMLAADGGPSVAVFDLGGWDTHSDQRGRMEQPLSALAQGLAALAQAMGPAWSRTVVAAASEFGRTVAMNGTNGTDHGTGGAVFLAGGAIRGGRVEARWPGLGRDRLHQGRDLAPTTDLRSVLKGVLRDHLGLGPKALDEVVFPESDGVAALGGLIRA